MRARLDFSHPALPAEQHRFEAPLALLVARRLDEVLPVLRQVDQAADAGRWAVGFVSYEAAPAFDPALPVRAADPALPLAAFAIYAAPAAAAAPDPAARFEATPWSGGWPADAFAARIDTIRRGIAAGDYYQVNLTARYEARLSGDAAALYQALRAAQPQSFGLLLEAGAWQVASVSPELFFDWRRAAGADGRLSVRPMKGTAPRHPDPAADGAARAGLLASDKERAENLMIVDLLRNDLSRVANLGSVTVPRLFEVEGLPTAWQMTSTVTCATPPSTSLAEVFAALFPCGSVTGAPKRAAMAAIAALEETPRGVYCGALGVVRPGGSCSFSVGIRSVVVQDGAARCGIGSGVTLDSTAAGEWDEWAVKRRFLWRATAPFELLETLRLEDGIFRLRQRHVERMLSGARHFGFTLDAQALASALDALAAAHPAGVFRVRLLAGRDGAVRGEVFAFDAAPVEASFVLAAAPVDADPELPADLLAHKTSWRSHYPAAPAGVFDVLLWNRRREVTEFTRGNLVYEWQGQRCTPPADGTLLPGVRRAELLAKGALVERPLRLDELQACGRLWFINSLRGELLARRVG